MNRLHLSVVIPTFARPEILRLTLEGLCAQSDSDSLLEVIVVNDGPDEVTARVVRSFSARLPIHYLEQPKRGVSSARNLGVASSRSPVVLLLDDDVIPAPELIKEHAAFHNRERGDSTALLGYVTWHPGLPISPFMRWYGEYGALFGYARLNEDEEISERFFYSCNISLKREWFLSEGGFNENLTVLEDNDLGYRLKQAGMILKFSRAALGYHYQTFTFKQSCKRLERYSSGLNAFLATDAGRSLARRRRSVLYRSLENLVKIIAPLLSPLLPAIDKNIGLPRWIYRLFYWYYGSHKAFWSRADQDLLLR